MDLNGSAGIAEALTRVGELLAADGEAFALVVLGGAALNLLGVVERATRDVDVVAFGVPVGERPPTDVTPPTEPLPEPLRRAVATVARDLRLPPDWLNTGRRSSGARGRRRGSRDACTGSTTAFPTRAGSG
jgi:hypothetical protein